MNAAGLIIILIALALGTACGKDGGQSFRDAVAVLCATDEEAGVANVHPAERQAAKSKWLDARLTNREVRDAFARSGRLGPQELTRAMMELAERAELKECAALARGAGGLPADLDLPVIGVASAGAVPLTSDGTMVTVIARSHELVVDGVAVLPLHDFLPDPMELTTPLAYEIVKLRSFATQLVASRGELSGARLGMPAGSPFRLLLQLVMSIKPAGIKRFELVARRDGQPVAVPIELPGAPPGGGAAKVDQLGMVVAVTGRHLTVFSISGREGSLSTPVLSTPGISSVDIAHVQAKLVEVHARHAGQRQIILMFDPTTPMQQVVETAAAVRAAPDGTELFPDVRLSAGFQ